MRGSIVWTFILVTWFCYFSCVPPPERSVEQVVIDLAKARHQEIINAKDRRDTSLIQSFLDSEDVNERWLAVEACASIQEPSLNPYLIRILNVDGSDQVRSVAAYAIGQSGDPDMLPELVSSFMAQDTSNYNSPIRGSILEAIGKLGDKETLNLIATASNYSPLDHHLLLGQARAIYRYGLRQIFDSKATELMIDRVLDPLIPDETRLIAAHFLSRFPNVDISSSIDRLTSRMMEEDNVNIQMALAGKIASAGDQDRAPILLSLLTDDIDYRVKINILRNLSSYNYSIYRDTLFKLLTLEDDHIFNITSDVLRTNAPRTDAQYFIDLARKSEKSERTARLLGNALNTLPSNYINTRRNISNELQQGLDLAPTASARIAFLKSLSLDPINIQRIIDYGLQSENLRIRTNAVASIRDLLTNTRTKSVYRRPSSMMIFKNAIADALSDLLEDGDPGTIAAVATLLQDEDCGFKEITGLNLALRSGMRKLNLPQDYEARSACLNALGFLEDTTYMIDPLAYNNDIDWDIISDIPDSSRAFVITPKGQIEIQLFKNHAPGSVANFVQLASSNFYDGKTIHRVVSNFVIQGGCPRGDGYGSLDYTIRSELGPKYYDDEGYLGMASAGKDTEGTQWFITHSPTPHLDGRYTIFGKVLSGMDVVHSIMPDDIIQDIRILKY